MYKLCIAILMCCACFPRGSAAPKTWGADPRSQPESNAEQNDMLQEEVDGQESILSKTPEQKRLSADRRRERHCARLLHCGDYHIWTGVQVRLHRSSVSGQPMRGRVQAEET